MTNLACVLWWLIPGMFLGWLLSWLFDLMFRRNGVPLLETAKAEAASALARSKGLESELAASRTDLSRHADDVKRLSADLTNVRSVHDQAQGSLGLLKSELDERNSSLSAAQQKHAQFEAALAAAKSEVQVAQGRYEVAHSNLEAMQRELAAAKSEIAASKSADSQHGAAASAEIAKLRGELTAALSARDQTQQSLSLIETERSKVKISLADLGSETDRLKAELAASQAGHQQLSATLSTLKTELGAAQSGSTGAASELAKLKAQIGVLQTAQEENGRLKDQLVGLNDQILTLRGVAGDHKSLADKATQEAHQLKAELAAARAKASKLELVERDHAALLSTHDEHKLAFGKLTAAHDDKANLIALLQADIEGNKRSHEALSGRVNDIERAAQLAAERRIAMTRYGFVSRTKDRDDLTLVEGIGPKIEELLLAAGVDSHAKLAVTPIEEIQVVLDKAGASFRIANPATWARQAALIVRNDWAELRRWQDVLIAGVELPKSDA